MNTVDPFTAPDPRSLPVLILADVSGSMIQDGKIDVLNDSIERMARSFAEEASRRGEVHLAVIAFGGTEAKIVKPQTPASEFHWEAVDAGGRTPMGAAFDLTRQLLEDRKDVPKRSYRPTIVLVSDGIPTDDWKEPLRRLHESERAAKAFRLAVAVGADADRGVLRSFVANDGVSVFEAHQAEDIAEFFQRVTMSVTQALSAGSYETAEALGSEDFFAGADE